MEIQQVRNLLVPSVVRIILVNTWWEQIIALVLGRVFLIQNLMMK